MRIRIVSEIALQNLISKLESNNIPYHKIELSDSSFPSFNALNYISEIYISKDHYEATKSILNELDDKDSYHIEIEKKKVKKKRNIIMIILILYALTVTIGFINFWHQNRKLNAEDNNFNLSFGLFNDIMDYTDKETGNLSVRYYDTNFDLNFEQIHEFANGEGPVRISLDLNENGYYEKIVFYSVDKNIVGRLYDFDEDNIFDKYEIILESGDTIVLTDKDKNAIYELENR